jgi:hypothetical protein
MPSAPPPDFRYVGLTPGPSKWSIAAVSGTVGLVTFGCGAALSALGGSPDLGMLILAGLAGLVTTRLVAHGRGPSAHGYGDQAPMTIVPWGVLIHSESTPRVLRWAAVRRVRVRLVHEMDHATPLTRWSVVTIETPRERFGGRAAGSVSLERLEANLSSYAEEAARPVAVDLAGRSPIDAPLEPCFERLLCEVRRLAHTGELSADLDLLAQGYRGGYRASPLVIHRLREVLARPVEGRADPRALAAILVAELELHELSDVVTRLSNCPHPLVALVSRAAALRLGQGAGRTGSVDEVADFVCESDLEQVRRWSERRAVA